MSTVSVILKRFQGKEMTHNSMRIIFIKCTNFTTLEKQIQMLSLKGHTRPCLYQRCQWDKDKYNKHSSSNRKLIKFWIFYDNRPLIIPSWSLRTLWRTFPCDSHLTSDCNNLCKQFLLYFIMQKIIKHWLDWL